MVRKASELCLPWQGSRPSNNKQPPFPQLKHDWPYPGTPQHTRLQAFHGSPARLGSIGLFSLDRGLQCSYTG